MDNDRRGRRSYNFAYESRGQRCRVLFGFWGVAGELFEKDFGGPLSGEADEFAAIAHLDSVVAEDASEVRLIFPRDLLNQAVGQVAGGEVLAAADVADDNARPGETSATQLSAWGCARVEAGGSPEQTGVLGDYV
mgnify:CR=1 FL=1